jgi:RimJ/RimL family protein N-acetyltransferase
MDAPSFRPLEEHDLPMMQAWLQQPHVAEWWGEPSTLEEVEAEFLPMIDGRSSTKAYIASINAQPVGFIQAYVVLRSGGGWWEDEGDPGARGIDQFLADAALLNRGLGTAMIAAFVERLFEDPRVTKVQTDPSPSNRRAIRCYSKVGFKEVGEVTTPDGPAVLMLYERPSLRLSAAASSKPAAGPHVKR